MSPSAPEPARVDPDLAAAGLLVEDEVVTLLVHAASRHDREGRPVLATALRRYAAHLLQAGVEEREPLPRGVGG